MPGAGAGSQGKAAQAPAESGRATGASGQGQTSDVNRPSPGQPGGLQAGTQAGRLSGGKAASVDAPERRLFPSRAPSLKTGAAGPGKAVENVSNEYADPSTRPAERLSSLPADYEKNAASDLSTASLPPARRRLVRNYFRNLRAAVTTQPATAPAADK